MIHYMLIIFLKNTSSLKPTSKKNDKPSTMTASPEDVGVNVLQDHWDE